MSAAFPTPGGWINDDGHIRYSAPPGSYRTLCVRTCDGYYFPMSSASSPSEFDRDQMNCQSSCPGTEVQIYYHRLGLESEDMVSGLSGLPYSELPTAYLYKQTDAPSPAGCTCSALKNDEARNFSIVAGNPPPEPPVEPVDALPEHATGFRRRSGNAGKPRRRPRCGGAAAHGGDPKGQQVATRRRRQTRQGRRACIPA